MDVEVMLPIRTVSEANRRDHWAVKAKRTKSARRLAQMAVTSRLLAYRGSRSDRWCPLAFAVTLTRVSPRKLDDDNLRGALKAVRDGVADALGLDDRDPRVTWEYGQESHGAAVYAVRVRVVRVADVAEAKAPQRGV